MKTRTGANHATNTLLSVSCENTDNLYSDSKLCNEQTSSDTNMNSLGAYNLEVSMTQNFPAYHHKSLLFTRSSTVK